MYKVLIWGTGNISKNIEKAGINAEVAGYIETDKKEEFYNGKPIYDVDKIPDDYDYIIVANLYGREIYQSCIEKKLDMNKVIFLQNLASYYYGDVPAKNIIEILGEKTTMQYLGNYIDAEDTFFAEDLSNYKKLNTRSSFAVSEEYLYPIISDKYDQAGAINSYLLQDLWAARLIHESGVKTHYDIGSRIDGFITHLLAMNIEVTLIDVRDYHGELDNLSFVHDDATLLNHISDESIESISALCSLEHFGLGRYGDSVDPEACFKCFESIQKKVKPGGDIYISVPIGKERVEFNAQRVFYASTITDCFSKAELKEFSCCFADKMDKNIEDIHKYDYFAGKGNIQFGLFHFVKR